MTLMNEGGIAGLFTTFDVQLHFTFLILLDFHLHLCLCQSTPFLGSNYYYIRTNLTIAGGNRTHFFMPRNLHEYQQPNAVLDGGGDDLFHNSNPLTMLYFVVGIIALFLLLIACVRCSVALYDRLTIGRTGHEGGLESGFSNFHSSFGDGGGGGGNGNSFGGFYPERVSGRNLQRELDELCLTEEIIGAETEEDVGRRWEEFQMQTFAAQEEEEENSQRITEVDVDEDVNEDMDEHYWAGPPLSSASAGHPISVVQAGRRGRRSASKRPAKRVRFLIEAEVHHNAKTDKDRDEDEDVITEIV